MTTAGTAPKRGSRNRQNGGTLAPVAELMPKELIEAGWQMNEHVGADRDKFQCHHPNGGQRLKTGMSSSPQIAIEGARRLESERQANLKKAAAKPPAPVALDKMPVLAKETRELPVPLTPEEIDARLVEWGDLDRRHDEIIAEAKRVADDYKGQAAQIAAESAGVQKELKARAEVREVETEDRADFPAKTVHMRRLDTGAVYDTRPMSQEELKQAQARLPSV